MTSASASCLYKEVRPYVYNLIRRRDSFISIEQREDMVQEVLTRTFQSLKRQEKHLQASIDEIRCIATGCARNVLYERWRSYDANEVLVDNVTLELHAEIQGCTYDVTCAVVADLLSPEPSLAEQCHLRLNEIRIEFFELALELNSASEVANDFWETEILRKSHKNLVISKLPDADCLEQVREWERRKKAMDRFRKRYRGRLESFFDERGISLTTLKSLGTRREVSSDSALRTVCLSICPFKKRISHVPAVRRLIS